MHAELVQHSQYLPWELWHERVGTAAIGTIRLRAWRAAVGAGAHLDLVDEARKVRRLGGGQRRGRRDGRPRRHPTRLHVQRMVEERGSRRVCVCGALEKTGYPAAKTILSNGQRPTQPRKQWSEGYARS